jgi:hypothetical protein
MDDAPDSRSTCGRIHILLRSADRESLGPATMTSFDSWLSIGSSFPKTLLGKVAYLGVGLLIAFAAYEALKAYAG